MHIFTGKTNPQNFISSLNILLLQLLLITPESGTSSTCYSTEDSANGTPIKLLLQVPPDPTPSATPSISAQPSSQPSSQPSQAPSSLPSESPSSAPSLQPSSQPSSQPSEHPSSQPSLQVRLRYETIRIIFPYKLGYV